MVAVWLLIASLLLLQFRIRAGSARNIGNVACACKRYPDKRETDALGGFRSVGNGPCPKPAAASYFIPLIMAGS